MKKKYPDVLTKEQRKRFDAAMKKIQPDLDRICKELAKSTMISARDLQIVINTR